MSDGCEQMPGGEEGSGVGKVRLPPLPGQRQVRGETRLALMGDGPLVRLLVGGRERNRDVRGAGVHGGLAGEGDEDAADAEAGQESRKDGRLDRAESPRTGVARELQGVVRLVNGGAEGAEVEGIRRHRVERETGEPVEAGGVGRDAGGQADELGLLDLADRETQTVFEAGPRVVQPPHRDEDGVEGAGSGEREDRGVRQPAQSRGLRRRRFPGRGVLPEAAGQSRGEAPGEAPGEARDHEQGGGRDQQFGQREGNEAAEEGEPADDQRIDAGGVERFHPFRHGERALEQGDPEGAGHQAGEHEDPLPVRTLTPHRQTLTGSGGRSSPYSTGGRVRISPGAGPGPLREPDQPDSGTFARRFATLCCR